MPFDGLMLNHIIKELDVLINGKINKIYQISNTELLLHIRSNKNNYKLIISVNSNYARINLTDKDYYIDQNPTNFTFIMRKYLENGTILSIDQYQNDRIALFKIRKTDEIGDVSIKYLIVELFNKDANIIITNENYLIIDCLKKNFSLDTEKRKFMNNTTYYFPEYDNKINPFLLTNEEFKNISLEPKSFIGLSATFFNDLPNEFDYNTFINRLNILKPIHFKYSSSNKEDIYSLELSNTEVINLYNSFNQMVDAFYYEKNLIDRMKQKTDSLVEFVSRKIKNLETKLTKLEISLKENQSYEKYRIYGELILNNVYNPNIENNQLIVFNYYTSNEEKINLDMKFNLKRNAENYFNKYRKLKNSIIHLNEQILITTDEIDYFKNIYEQLKICNIEDALQIKDELIEQKYLKDNNNNANKKKKKKISILTYILDNNVEVLVGKNNIQNALITTKLASKDFYFFHVKDFPSSHVVCKTNTLDEYTIRSCAKICTYHSRFNNSSSVPIIYTQIKNVSKIKSFKNSYVKYKNEKTIYIDPDDEFINNLKKINNN